MMGKYIDAEAMIARAFQDSERMYLESVARHTPSIDLVRCKECKHWRNTDAEKIPTASIACGNMHADDFCSYGERKENE